MEKELYTELFNDSALNIVDLEKLIYQQVQKFDKWGLRWATAVQNKENKKDIVDALKGEIEIEIRENPEKYEIKLTEGAVKALVVSDPRLIKAKKESAEALGNEKEMFISQKGIDTLKDEINNLRHLYLSGFFGALQSPDMSAITSKIDDEHIQKNLTTKLRRRKKNAEKE